MPKEFRTGEKRRAKQEGTEETEKDRQHEDTTFLQFSVPSIFCVESHGCVGDVSGADGGIWTPLEQYTLRLPRGRNIGVRNVFHEPTS
jgi:hypothetical protein